MTEQDYNEFLQKIDDFINRLEADQNKEQKKSEFATIIGNLNNAATTKYIDFIKQNPESYNSRIQKLKEALSFDQSLANSVIGITQSTSTPAPSTPTDTTQPATPTTTPDTGTTAPVAGTPTTPSTTPTAEAPAIPEPTQEALNAAFAKYMGSSYNPNSSMDKGKMETVKNALKKFQEETGKQFDINDSEDLNKMRPIMNAAYQSEEYKKVAGVGISRAGGGQGIGRPAASPRQQAGRQPKPLQLPVVGRGVEQMYVDKGGKFVPATDADYNSGQQLYAQKKKGTFDFLRSPKDRFQKVTRNRTERATRP